MFSCFTPFYTVKQTLQQYELDTIQWFEVSDNNNEISHIQSTFKLIWLATGVSKIYKMIFMENLFQLIVN